MKLISNQDKLNQQAFEESFECLDDLVAQESEPLDEDDEVIDYQNPCYNEIKFDEDGNYVHNFLGHDK